MSKRSITVMAFFVGIVIGGWVQPFRYMPSFAQAGCQTFPETGYSVCDPFLSYWANHGGLAQQGYPISTQFAEVSDLDGKTYTVQYFERAEFEYHPEFVGTPNDVLLSQLGTFRYKEKYPTGNPGVLPAPTSAPILPTTIPSKPTPHAFGDLVPLAPGVVLVATSFELKRPSQDLPPYMDWTLEVRNSSGHDFPIQLDVADISVTDNAGNNYLIDSSSSPTSPVAKSGEAFPPELWIFTQEQQIFDIVKYFDLTINKLSGISGPFVFRRYIQP